MHGCSRPNGGARLDLSSWFGGDVDALNKMGSIDNYVLVGRIGIGALFIAIVCFVVSGAINFDAKNRAHQQYLSDLQGEGLTAILWTATPKKLAELDFGSPVVVGNLSVFRREVPGKPPTDADAAYPMTNVVLQRGGRTIAVADIVRIHQSASWDLASSDKLVMGSEVVSLSKAFESPEFRKACEPLQGKGVSIIFVGLESYPTRDRQKDADLSDKRATALGEACLSYTAPILKYPEGTMFWAVGLGRANTETEVNSAPEVRQRAAVMMTVTRRQTRDDAISIPEVFGLLIRTTQVSGTVLADYSESANAAERLRISKADLAGFLPAEARKRPAGASVH